MADATGGFALLLEAFDAHGVTDKGGLQHLDGYDPVHQGMARLIDNAHTALSEKLENLIVASKRRADQRVLDDANQRRAIVRARSNDARKLAIALEADLAVETVVNMFR